MTEDLQGQPGPGSVSNKMDTAKFLEEVTYRLRNIESMDLRSAVSVLEFAVR